MNTQAAEDHYHWRMQVGHHRRTGDWMPGQPLHWDTTGYGCLVHPQIVLTSLSAWEKAAHNRYEYEVMAVAGQDHAYSSKKGKTLYTCELGHADKQRDLAALVLDRPFLDEQGNPPKSYPQIAEEPPAPGQVLCVLSHQYLLGRDGHNGSYYVCFLFGSVCLLRSETALLYALSGIVTNERHVGAAVFDQSGKIYGIVTEYLMHNPLTPSHNDAAGAGRFVVFSPVYGCGSKLLRLPSQCDVP